MNFRHGSFSPDQLALVKRGRPARQIELGDVVRLRSGGPNMLVVDIQGDDIMAAWSRDEEETFKAWTLEFAFAQVA